MSVALEEVLAALSHLHPREIDLSLGRTEILLAKLGNPHHRLPPVFHVAGTNGKGSTVAFIRSCLEAAGKRVHVYTSPHLVRFNERIRLNGKLIDDDMLIEVLRDVQAVNAGEPITLFEIITVAAFLSFARVPADAVILEVGLGGRLDATNVISRPASTGIAQLAMDHEYYLGDTLLKIAVEKAGIAKANVPLVHGHYSKPVMHKVAECAAAAGAKLIVRGTDWDVADYQGALHYRDDTDKISAVLPKLNGAFQIENAGLAIAMLRHQKEVVVSEAALKAGLGWAEWPARVQQITKGPLVEALAGGSGLWLDGGHNPAAGKALATHFASKKTLPLVMIVAMLSNKDCSGFIKPFAGLASRIIAVPLPGTDHTGHEPQVIVEAARAYGLHAETATSAKAALHTIAEPSTVLMCGSLYFAGYVLAESGITPG